MGWGRGRVCLGGDGDEERMGTFTGWGESMTLSLLVSTDTCL